MYNHRRFHENHSRTVCLLTDTDRQTDMDTGHYITSVAEVIN